MLIIASVASVLLVGNCFIAGRYVAAKNVAGAFVFGLCALSNAVVIVLLTKGF